MRHDKPTVTMFADASIYAQHRVAGWAGFIRADAQSPVWVKGKAPFTNKRSCVDDAETYALSRTVLHAKTCGLIEEGTTHVLLQSDSLTALSYFWFVLDNCHPTRGGDAQLLNPKKPNNHSKSYVSEVGSILRGMEVVYLKHVKGHRNGVRARSWVNERCDKLAKEEARRQL